MKNWLENVKTTYKDNVNFKSFLVVLLLSGLSYGFYKGVQDNYLAEIIKINEFERGVFEFFRELPGLLLIVFLAFMKKLGEKKIYQIGLFIMLLASIGLVINGNIKILVVLFMVLYSLGEHLIIPLKSSISMGLAKEGKGGLALGVTSSFTNIGSIVSFVLVMILFVVFDHFNIFMGSSRFLFIFALAAILLLFAFFSSFFLTDTNTTQAINKKFYFHKRFNKYYVLEVFYGARKQIFLTFGPYVLILFYGASASVISFLFAICSLFSIALSPAIGRLIDKLGYKFVMVTDTLLLVVVCFFYGFSHRIFPMHIAYIVVCINYVLDAIISIASMASSVYVQDIAESPEEVPLTLSTGVSVNHLITLIIALFGGWIWQTTGIEMLFILSAILGLMNTLFALTIKNQKKVQINKTTV